MNKKLGLIAFSLLLFVSQMAVSQSDKVYIKQADDIYAYGAKADAQQLYLLALDANPNNVKANFMAGVIYFETIHRPRALKYFLKAYELNAQFNPISLQADFKTITLDYKFSLLYYIGKAYHYSHDFDNAISYYNRYSAELDKMYLSKKITKEILDEEKAICKRRIYECVNGKEFVADPVDVVIENLGDAVNSEYSDFSPVVSADEEYLFFTSRRPGGYSDDVARDNMYYEDIYFSKKEGDSWGQAQNIGKIINEYEHDASVSLSPDGNELFIYKSSKGGSVYSSVKDSKGEWGMPKIVQQIKSTKSFEPHATINAEGNKMYFVSDRAGGLGGTDIWITEKDKSGKWGEPYNAGDIFNTEYDEEGVLISPDGKTFYFSSQGHKGMGGYDIFKSVYDETTKKWSTPENLGYPINTSDDDVYISFSGDGKRAYYASAKDEGIGEKDIYVIYIREIEEPKVEEPKVDTPIVAKKEPKLMPVTLRGKVYDASTKQTLSGVPVEIRSAIDNSVVTIVNTNQDGEYRYEFTNSKSLEYTVTAQKQGYIYASEKVTVPEMKEEPQTVTKDLYLNKAVVGTKIIIRNIYYDFDKYSLKAESFAELDKIEKLMLGNPNLKLEIAGHTDKIGSDEYNQTLSERRAASVVKYLVNKGISKDRLVTQGYGEKQPLVSNDDEKDGREINRRTEFEILEN